MDDTEIAMDQTDLELQVGDALQLQFVGEDASRRCHSRVIGYLDGQSVVVTTPRKDGKTMFFREGQLLVARMLSGNTVYAFNTSVLRSCTQPYPYLHLSFPKELEKIVVRKAHRARAHLVASVQAERPEQGDVQPASVVVVDISTTGAMLRSDTRFAEVGDLVTIQTRLNVANVQEYLAIPALVRNVRQEEARDKTKPVYSTGVEFQLMDQRDSVVLHGYVYERLIHG